MLFHAAGRLSVMQLAHDADGLFFLVLYITDWFTSANHDMLLLAPLFHHQLTIQKEVQLKRGREAPTDIHEKSR